VDASAVDIPPRTAPIPATTPLSVVRWTARSLASHGDLLWQMVTTDLRGRYVGSSLGLFWTVIHPLVMITIYIVVFSQIMGAKLDGNVNPYAYGIYLCAGLLPWIAFQEVVVRLTTIFPDNGNLVRKIAFPKVLLFGYVTLSAAINFLAGFGVFLLAMVLTGQPLRPIVILWLPMVALQLAFGLGLGMITAVLHVFIRDTAHLTSVVLQLAFWATPIVYVESILPDWLRRVQYWNPLAVFSRTHRDIILSGVAPGTVRMVGLLALTGATLAVGTALYRHFRADILDEL
jgi:lipopolysaccharide transport system permease protein